jgi:hypothetical protein
LFQLVAAMELEDDMHPEATGQITESLTADLLMHLDGGMTPEVTEQSRTELDTHANMPVVGQNAYILAESGKTVDVSPYTPDYQSMTVPMVDAAVQYDDPYNGKTYILVL